MTKREDQAGSEELAQEAREKFRVVQGVLNTALIERYLEIELLLTALLCREHVLLVGPPGCGKTLALESIARWLGGRKFIVLLTKFTTPEELYGPFDVPKMLAGEFVRNTVGRLPEAEVVVVDEVFKASSAILNTLLTVLNERVFDVGNGTRVAVPLQLCAAASNEWPSGYEGGKELSALFDRFLFRRSVRPIATPGGLQQLLWNRSHEPIFHERLGLDELDAAQLAALSLPWSAEARDALTQILAELRKEGICPGDRRKFKSVAACQASAWLAGSDEVQPEHLEVLSHVLWEDPTEQSVKCSQVVGKIANPVGATVAERLAEADQVLQTLVPSDTNATLVAIKKLQEIAKKFKELPAQNSRVKSALGYVQDEVKRLKVALTGDL